MSFGAGIWLFGQFVDRYATDAYGPPVSTLEAIERAGAVGDLEVLDINYPFSDPDITVEEVARALDAAGLGAGASRRTSTRGSSRRARSPTPIRRVRRRALELCEEAVDVARRLGAPTVKLWPGQDGFDFPFQADYRELWRLALDGVRTVAEMDDDIRVAIEYKTKEPRTHMSWSTAARTLVGIQQIGREDIGIVVDLGHSLFAKETPADALLARARPRSAVHDRGQRQLARVGRRHGGRLDPPDRDARVLPRGPPASAGTSRSCSTSSRSARIRSRRRATSIRTMRAIERRSTGSTSTRSRTRRRGRTRSRRSASLTDLLLGDPALAATREQ